MEADTWVKVHSGIGDQPGIRTEVGTRVQSQFQAKLETEAQLWIRI